MGKLVPFAVSVFWLGVGVLALAFVSRNFLPASWRALFDFRGA